MPNNDASAIDLVVVSDGIANVNKLMHKSSSPVAVAVPPRKSNLHVKLSHGGS